MQIAAMTYSFASLLDKRETDTPRIIRYYAELGVPAVEITSGYVREEEMTAIQAALAETGMSVASYDLVCDVVTADAAVRRDRTAQFRTNLQRAAELKAKIVLVVPGPPREGISHAQARQWFAEALRAALPDAARLGFALTIPNVGWQPVVYGTSDQILGICEAAGPELRVTYDVGNFLLAGEDNLQALDRVAPRLAHVHFKDWEILPATCPGAFPGVDGRPYLGAVLGEGILNLRKPLERLRRLGYKGAISMEYEGTNDPYEAVRRGVTYLRSLLEAKPAPA